MIKWAHCACVVLSGAEGSRPTTLDSATGFLDFARNDDRFSTASTLQPL